MQSDISAYPGAPGFQQHRTTDIESAAVDNKFDMSIELTGFDDDMPVDNLDDDKVTGENSEGDQELSDRNEFEMGPMEGGYGSVSRQRLGEWRRSGHQQMRKLERVLRQQAEQSGREQCVY